MILKAPDVQYRRGLCVARCGRTSRGGLNVQLARRARNCFTLRDTIRRKRELTAKRS